MKIADEMNARLTQAFAPRVLKITDDSESHRGHAGFRDGGQSHFEIEISAEIFGRMSRIERHRAVHTALGRDLVASIHALALKISD
jgi:BolA protein